MFLHAVESVLSMLILIAVGYVLCGAKWFRENGPTIFSKYAINVAIPCSMFTTFTTTVGTRENLAATLSATPVPVAAICAGFLLSVGLARLLRISPRRRGVFINAATFSNTVIIGFPVVQILFGDGALSDAIVYYVCNTVFFWTIGSSLLFAREPGEKRRFEPKDLKKLASPALVGMLLAAALIALGISLPGFISYPIETLGKSATAVSMIFTGSIIRGAGLRSIRPDKDLVAVMASRFLLQPALTLGICLLAPISTQAKLVFLVMSALPAMTQLGIVAKERGSDYEFASVVVTLTTLVSMAVIPLYMLLAEGLHLFG